VISGTEAGNGFYAEHVPKLFIHNEYNAGIIENVLKRQKHCMKLMMKEIQTYKRSNIDPRAFCILDDCLYDAGWTKDKLMRLLFMNGRHWKVMLVLTMQYCMDLPVNLRTNIDYVFLMRETNPAVVERLYKNFGGSFSTLPAFAEALRLCTEDHGCMVIDNVRSAVFHYRAKDRGDFRVFHSKVWSYSKKRNVKSTSRPSVARASDGTIVRCHH
jgi:hypothetical protein